MELFINISGELWTLTTKIAFVFGLFLFTLIFAILPMAVIKSYQMESNPDRRVQYSRLIGMLNCFAGGVFLGTALLHLLPEVTFLISQVHIPTSFPVAEFSVACGFLVVLVLEQTGLACKEQQVDTLNPVQRLSQQPLPFIYTDPDTNAIQAESETGEPRRCVSSNLPAEVVPTATTHLRSVLLLAVLSIHSIFEGLAVGLQTDIKSTVNIFLPVMIHKIIIAFSMGLALLQSQVPLSSVLALDIMFALMSPTGLLIGLYVNTYQTSPRQQLFSGLLQGIACGTFLFITFFEVLPRELLHCRDRLLKLLTLLLGFSATVLVIFFDDS